MVNLNRDRSRSRDKLLRECKTDMASPTNATPPSKGDLQLPMVAYAEEKTGGDATVRLLGTRAYKRFHHTLNYERELSTLSELPPHPCIVELLETDRPSLTIVMNRYETDLMCALLDGAPVPTQLCAERVLQALVHCHRHHVVHRDVKPENVLLDLDGGGLPVLSDFARAAYVSGPMDMLFGGTIEYAAPEARQGICSPTNDAWSVGVLIYCLVEELFPFEQPLPAADEELCFKAPAWAEHPRLQDVMPRLLCVDYAQRCSCASALRWISCASVVPDKPWLRANQD